MMDTSETYIKMCDNPYIQGQRQVGVNWQEGDYFCWKPPSGLIVTLAYDCWCDSVSHAASRDEGDTWLPTQSQLQEMVGGFESFPKFWQEFNGYENKYDIDEAEWAFCKGFTSMEQLWLAFMMKENRNKTWDGEAWS